jgi:5'-3' exonuclease
MGIPAYFSHLVKNYIEIITKLENLNKSIDNFYLDCNSIIYDSARTIEFTTKQKFEKELIKSVCEKIDNYIFEISPRQNVFISFDGVAPVAKLQLSSKGYEGIPK